MFDLLPYCLANFLLLAGTTLLTEDPQLFYEGIDACQARHPDMILDAHEKVDEYGPLINIICGCMGEQEARRLRILKGHRI
tara:strand:+ start:495 stop:737 length:243 start_codon:yes stop_codon:yes gene_type:complete